MFFIVFLFVGSSATVDSFDIGRRYEMKVDLDAMRRELRQLDEAELLARRAQGDAYVPEAQAAIAEELQTRGVALPPRAASPITAEALQSTTTPFGTGAKVIGGSTVLIAVLILLGLLNLVNPIVASFVSIAAGACGCSWYYSRPSYKLKLAKQDEELRQKKRAEAQKRIGKDGYTELMFVSADGGLARAQELLQCGADVNARDSGGFTALMYAASSGHSDIVDLLLSHKADGRLRSGSAKTAADYAAAAGHQEIRRRLNA